MKHLLGIVTIALFIQVSLAGPLQRFKRDDYAMEGFKGLYDLSKDLVRATEPAVINVLKNMPKTNTYAKYRQEIKTYLEDVNQYKITPGPCLEKTFKVVYEFVEMLQTYGQESAPAEAKYVLALLDEYSDEEMENKLNAWEERFRDTDIEEDINNLDGLKMAGLMREVC